MQTRALQTLVRVAVLGSFANVAEELGTTISTVSMQIKSIEDQLGLELFDRSHRPPKLTPVGRMVCERAKVLLNAEKKLLDLASQDGDLTGSFRIGFVATASVRLLPGFLKNVRLSNVDATFQIETALSETLEARVESGAIDAAVVTESEQNAHNLDYHLLCREQLMFAAPADFKGMSISLLRQELPFLQFNPGSGIGKLIQGHMAGSRQSNSRPDIVLESVEAIIECVNEGLGFTLLPEPDIRRYASDRCHIFSMKKAPLTRNLSLAFSRQGLPEITRRRLIGLF